jgi:hypothetical protein
LKKCLGIQWDLVSDCVSAIPRYNIYGSLRGRTLGPDLREMSEDTIMEIAISRLLWMRICAQTFSRLGNLLAPVIMSCKILASRACELASTDEMTLDLSPRDVEFVDTSKQFLLNLRRIDQVKPFKRAFAPENHTLIGFVGS